MSASIILARAKFDDRAKPTITLWKLIGSLSAAYSLIHYLLMPMADPILRMLYAVLVVAWVISLLDRKDCPSPSQLRAISQPFQFEGKLVRGA